MGVSVIRGAVLVIGGLMILGGLAAITLGGQNAAAGLWSVVVGGVLVIAAVLERTRYRSEQADRSNEPPGPGGGEPTGAVEARFQRTDEVFVDPTTGRRMRVLLDPRTGERRYMAET
jgi:hypothetical protein